MITTQKEIRENFWQEYPEADRRKIKNYAGDGLMYKTDTRVLFVDYVDYLQKSGEISEALAQRVTL